MDKRALFFIGLLTVTLFGVNYWLQPTPTAKPPPPIEETISESSEQSQLTKKEDDQEFYVLENPYLQLVFSTRGGALAEINLPFQSASHPDSVVKPIGVDRQLATSPEDQFPAHPYFTVGDSGQRELTQNPETSGYYPLIRRNGPPRYYAFSCVADREEKEPLFTVKQFSKDRIEFESVTPERKITKVFTFPSDPEKAPYVFDLSIRIEGEAKGLYLTSGVPEVELISGSASPTLKYRISRSGKAEVEKLSIPKTPVKVTSLKPDWICNSNGFFGIVIDPLSDIPAGYRINPVAGIEDPTRLSLVDPEYHLYPAEKYPGYEFLLPLKESRSPLQFRVFAGPFQSTVLKTVDNTFADPKTGYQPDYKATQSFHGWFSFISEPFAKFLFLLMQLFYKITHSWGFSIILLTAALRVMLYPLNAWSIKSTAKMQQIGPQVAAIQERHKKEPKRAQMEVMQLYREKGVNPFSGCLPLLIQMPFLIGMFDLLKSTFQLRGASFIPGWIDNLTAPDVLFRWHYPIPFIGTEFHLLPLILGAVMLVQQRYTSMSSAKRMPLTDQQRQQQAMGNIMTLVFTVMFYNFPSGLNLYWLFSMVFGILQQWIMTRKPIKTTNTILRT